MGCVILKAMEFQPPFILHCSVNQFSVFFQANTEFSLENLLPNTEYLVKIQAVSFWGQKRLKSSKSQLIISTTLKGRVLTATYLALILTSPGYMETIYLTACR